MNKPISVGAILLVLLCSNYKGQTVYRAHKTQNMYEYVSEKPVRDIEYEFIQQGKLRNGNAPMGDLLSRMWGHFGRPRHILFEGYDYTIRDKKTGLEFLVSYGASGPAFHAEKSNIQELSAVIQQFEKFLDDSPNATCEIEVDTDFGIYLCGAKNGIPYNNPKDPHQEEQFDTSATGNVLFDDLIFQVRDSMEKENGQVNRMYSENDIRETEMLLTLFVKTIYRATSKKEADHAVMAIVVWFNNMVTSERKMYMGLEQRDQIIKIINLASQKTGYSTTDEDVTKEWRKF